MRILAHIHTFNDADIIGQVLDSIRRQTRPPDAILIVDNASTDGTLDRAFPEGVTVIRKTANVGTSGAVRTGLTFALEHKFDWIWVFDADSVAEHDALEKLLSLYEDWPKSLQDETAFVACMPYNRRGGQPHHGGIFTRYGVTRVNPPPEQRYYPCHVTIWSGCLYRMAAVRQIGLPNPNYMLDWGESEYGYRVMKAGYKGFIDRDAILRHNIRGYPSLTPTVRKFGPLVFRFYEFPPLRCYYSCRNELYFALYEAAQGRFGLLRGAVWRVRPAPGFPGMMRGTAWRVILLTLNFVLRPRHHGQHILACLRGIWHGVTGNLAARY